MRKAFFMLIAVLAFAFLAIPTQAQIACKYTMRWTEWGHPSPPYNACGPEMTTTFDYEIFWGTGGYSGIHCVVINSGWDEYYWAPSEPYGHGQKSGTHHCTNLKNHQLFIEYTTDLDPGKKFQPNYFQADYATGTPQSPEP